jgi:hypothetical protein
MNQRGPLRLPFLFMLAGAAGCAASGQLPSTQAPVPADPESARQELVALEQQIEQDRQALGLAPAPESAAPEQGQRPAGASAEARMPRPTQPPPAAEPPPSLQSDAATQEEAMEPMELKARQEACSRPCRLAHAICKAAARICQLADFLGEEDARRRCGRAREDCEEAREAVRDRDCSGCS